MLCTAVTISTSSVERAIMTVLLCAVLNQKADLEEVFLNEKFGRLWREYKEKTKQKFIPFLF
jgi:protein-S-isoprenylcysteine O-methyltransferase Ste14